MTTHVVAGDSMSDGTAGAGMIGWGSLYWPYLLAALRGEPSLINLAIGGQGVADQADAILAHTPQATEAYFMFLGNVDQTWRGASAGALQLYKSVLAAELACWGTDKAWMTDPIWTLSGAWSGFMPWGGQAKYTQVQGAFAEASFSGDIAELAYVVLDGIGAGFSITIDGALIGSFSTSPPTAVATCNPSTTRNYAPVLLRFIGLGDGAHTIRVTKTDAIATPIILLWIRQGSNGRPVYVLTLPNCADGKVQGRIVEYNYRIRDIVAEAIAAGINAHLVDVGPLIVPATDVVPNDIHLINQGQAKYAAAVSAAMS